MWKMMRNPLPGLLALGLLSAGLALADTSGVDAEGNGQPEEGPVSIAVLVNDLGNPYFQALAASARATARAELGADATVTVVSSGYGIERQRAQLLAAQAEGHRLIIISAAHPAALSPVIDELRADDIAVVAVDVAVSGAHITITTYNDQAGFMSCEHLAVELDGAGRVGILGGPPTASFLARVSGCEEALADFPDIEIVAHEDSAASYVGGIEAMTRLLARHADLDAVFSVSDLAAQGAATAARFSDRAEVRIASVDGSPEVVQALQAGDTPLLNTAAQFPRLMGSAAVERGLHFLRTGDVSEDMVLIRADIIHAGNAGRYCDWQRC